MTRNRASRILPFAGACVLAAMTAQANVVDYSATGVIETVDNSSALLPHSLLGAAVGKSFTFNFAVDTATPGSSVALGDETYLSAVQSASYKFGGTTSAFDISSNAVDIANDFGGLTGYVMAGGDTVGADFTGIAGAVSFVTLAYSGVTLYLDTALSNAPLSAGHADFEDALTLSFTQYVGGAATSNSSQLTIGPMSIKQVSVSAPEIDGTSAASGLTLLMGGLLVLLGRRRNPFARTV
jgi:hypothetical protein